MGFLETFSAWSGPSGHQVLLDASILSQNGFLLPSLQLNELRAMMGSVGQQAVCPEPSSNTKLVRKLIHHCERLQEQLDSLVPQLMQRPQKTQVGSWQHGGLERLCQDPRSGGAHCNAEQPLATPPVWFGWLGSMAGN